MRDCLLLGVLLPILGLMMATPRALGDDESAKGARVRQPVMVLIKPGTIVDGRPPLSWSHLVIRSLPRLASGDLQTLPRSAFRTATLIRTVILADVGRNPDRPGSFVLRRLGIGLCVPDRSGRDVVVRSGRLDESDVSLGIVEKVVLKSAEAELNRGRLVAATPTFALYRGPAMMPGEHGHHTVLISYAFLVDPRSGSLRTFVWAQDARRTSQDIETDVVELKPDLHFDCPLNVQAERLLGAVPVSWSFAMEKLPPGRSLAVPVNLSRILRLRGAGAIGPDELEKQLRQSFMGRPPSSPAISGP